MIDVVALGECLIDFTPNGENTQGIALFARNPGGAPANVLAMNACLGGKTAFIGKVGKDGFGDFLRQTLIDSGHAERLREHIDDRFRQSGDERNPPEVRVQPPQDTGNAPGESRQSESAEQA